MSRIPVCIRLCAWALLLLPGRLAAQYDSEFQTEFLFERIPNTRAEALGRADVADGSSPASIFYNPAAIAQVQRLQTDFSTAAPLYLLGNADFYYAGAAYRFHKLLSAGLSYRRLDIGESDFEIFINGNYYPINKPRSSNAALTLASEPVKNLRIGVNVNFYDWKYLDGEKNARQIHLDAGAMYTLELPIGSGDPHALTFGASVTNFLNSGIEFGVGSFRTVQKLPIVARTGAAYRIRRTVAYPGMDAGPIELVFMAEYQDVLNSPYKTAFRLGGETVLMDVLALRLGFFTSSEDDSGVSTNRSRINDVTFGAGLIAPLDQLTGGKIPCRAALDVTVLKQPPFTFSGQRLPNFRSFGLRLDWTLPGA
ncbi:MAG: hypothetical protein NW241_00975 [Bacteroidia bacterium]|nr:hypothetical protein [Bacteroidia bacterium]